MEAAHFGDAASTAYRIDPLTLRAVPLDPVAMRRAAAALEAKSRVMVDSAQAAAAASSASIWFAMIGEFERARALAEFALAHQAAPHMLRERTTTEIRLAQIHQLQSDTAAAQSMLAAIVGRCRETPELKALLDFALQHYGKLCFENAQHAQALGAFREALELRESKGAAALIASTKQAIQRVERVIDGQR